MDLRAWRGSWVKELPQELPAGTDCPYAWGPSEGPEAQEGTERAWAHRRSKYQWGQRAHKPRGLVSILNPWGGSEKAWAAEEAFVSKAKWISQVSVTLDTHHKELYWYSLLSLHSGSMSLLEHRQVHAKMGMLPSFLVLGMYWTGVRGQGARLGRASIFTMGAV